MGVANWPAYAGYSLCVQVRWDGERCPFYRVAGCPLFRGFQCIEVYMYIRSGQSQVSVISWASAVEGCPLSGVPLYIMELVDSISRDEPDVPKT